MRKLSHSIGTGIAAVLAAGACGAVQPMPPADGAIIGEATLVIGAATVRDANGQSRSVARGDAVRVGDRIETRAGGHVHLRFVDGGRLSVRPDSRLQIESYSHSSAQPQLGAIKFRLDEGVARSITGTWGEAARERFRLNTPVAAIGVKGTDFIVRAAGDTTSASIYSGAITVAPLTGGCAASVGPCLNGSERLLSEDMKGLIVALDRHSQTAAVLPAIEQWARHQAAVASAAAARSAAGEASASADKIASASTDKAVALDGARSESGATVAGGADKNLVNDARGATVVVAAAPSASDSPALPGASTGTSTGSAPGPVPGIVPEQPPPQAGQLVAARTGATPALPGDSFTQRFEQAVVAGLEHVAGSGPYAVLRPRAPADGIQLPAQGQASFRLASATAHLQPAGGAPIEAVAVQGGNLSVDFSRATFATMLDLSSPSIGRDELRASGSISASGILRASQGGTAIDGALSADAREAAYAFDKQHAAGSLRGITLWGR